MKKDVGWQTIGFIRSKKGGSYNAPDGSYGTWYSDGSGDYHGADGTYGTWYSDGSGDYHGADGSYGTWYSDGSGYYNGADGTYDSWDSDDDSDYQEDDYDSYSTDSSGSYPWGTYEDSEVSNDDNSSLGSKVIGTLLGVGLAAVVAAKSDSSNQNNDNKVYRKKTIKEENREHFVSDLKEICITLLVIGIILAFIGYGIASLFEKRGVKVGTSSRDFIGMNYEETQEKLEKKGFCDIECTPIYDLEVEEERKENTVKGIVINDDSSFGASDRFSKEASIKIYYHMVKKIAVPISAKKAKGKNYEKVVAQLEEAGFTNITTTAHHDLIVGWVNKKGSIEKITINNSSKFKKDDEFRPDVEIVIKYHAF